MNKGQVCQVLSIYYESWYILTPGLVRAGGGGVLFPPIRKKCTLRDLYLETRAGDNG